MTGMRWLASPLTATALVLTGLGLLAIPLRRLTSAPVKPPPMVVEETHAETVHAVLRLKVLSAARTVVIRSGDRVLLENKDLPAGETEEDVRLPLGHGPCDLTLTVDFGESAGESAAFLTVMPDGLEDQTRYVVGSGQVTDLLHYEWHVH